MSSIRSKLVRSLIVKRGMRKLFNPFLTTIDEMRGSSIKVNKRLKLPKDAIVTEIKNEKFKAEWLRAGNVENTTKNVILYFHSGAFCLGYNNPHRLFALELSRACNAKVFAVDYRLAPEHKYPAANDDCFAAYKWLIESGVNPRNLVIGGDSAGAGLSLMTLLALKKAGNPMPIAAFLISLFGGDLKRFDGESYETRKLRDQLNFKEGIQHFAKLYLGDQEINPPIDENLNGLPSLLIQVGSDEILLSDSVRLAENAKNAGVKVVFEEWQDMWQVFQGFSMIVPEAKKAMCHVAEFINDNLGKA